MSSLPNGYGALDKTQLRGRLKNDSPLSQSLRSILVKDRTLRGEKDTDNKTKPPISKVKSISDIISNNIQASMDLRTITHYIKRAEQIWTTLLLKPNGEQRQLLIYDSESSEVKNSKLHELLLQKVENHFTTKFPFEEIAPQIIKDVLFRTGSYVNVEMSHAVLDHLINGMEVDGSESFKATTSEVLAKHFVDSNWNKAKNVGYIRKERRPNNAVNGFEALYGSVGTDAGEEYHLVHPDLKWTFTDNPVVIKATELAQRMREDRLREMSGMEGLDSAIGNVFKKKKGKAHKSNNNRVLIPEKKSLERELDNLYPNRNYNHLESLSVRKGKFYSGNGRGTGIGFQWPSEACINVMVNGQVGKPFGHILLIDPDSGEPLKNTSDVKFYQTARGAGGAGDVQNKPKMGGLNDIVAHIRTVAQGKECVEDMGWMAEFTSATLEKEFIEGFFNGDLHKDVSVSLTEENKKLFLSRALRDQGVRAIFVPSEYVTYVATDFTRLGVGRSLVDEAKIHIARLAVLETADMLAQIENSISHTTLEITPEREDVDVRNTTAMVRDEWFAGNPTLHDILGYNNVSIDAILDRFKEQSVTVKINAGDNPHVVAPDIQANQSQREPLKSIEPETRENLLNTIAGFFGLKRSWLEDTGDGNDFAIEALADQELLRNQTNEYSRIFSRFFTDIMRKHMRVNEPLISELVDIIKENKNLYTKPDQTGELKVDEEAKEKVNQTGDEDTSVEDLEQIELVLKDFLNTFYVVLPTPAITDSLNKLEDKIEAVEKLVETWVNLGGGSKLLKRRADAAGLVGDDVVENMKAILLNEAFERFNLPMPFEAILNNGRTGGMMAYISKAVDLDSNVIQFLLEWEKGTRKNNKKAATLQEKVDKANNAGLAEDENNSEAQMDDFNTDDPASTEATDDFTGEMTDEQTTETDEGTEEESTEEDDAAKQELDEDTTPKGGDDLWSQ